MISIDKPNTKEKQAGARKVPRLQNGDRLTRSEFERRYNAMPNTKKAELIEGVVYMPSPVSHRAHGEPHANLLTMLGVYRIGTSATQLSDNATVRLDFDNEPQPDILLRIEKNAGGTSIVDEDGYIQGTPELVVEIANSTASYDMHDKLNSYRRNGVQEYIVWLVGDEQLLWYTLKDSEYRLLEADDEGTVRSLVFPGLWLNLPAILTSDLNEALATVQAGIKSPEHQRFVSQLEKAQKE